MSESTKTDSKLHGYDHHVNGWWTIAELKEHLEAEHDISMRGSSSWRKDAFTKLHDELHGVVRVPWHEVYGCTCPACTGNVRVEVTR